MFSEAVHTLVDVGNQAILAYGLREAAKAPDNRYQYGYVCVCVQHLTYA